jgi:hypothetical protein
LLLLIVASVIGWHLSVRSTAADEYPQQKWGYVPTLLGSPSKTYGPFTDIASCDRSLWNRMTC